MPARAKVLVAMSGGVDSSVAAALLLRRGFDVVGVFMRLGSPGERFDELLPGDDAPACASGAAAAGAITHRGCCSVSDAADARLVAAQLGIPFYVCNFKKEFGRIIDYFVGDYAQGRTPNPCVRCNDWLKFGRLHDYAAQIDADFVATGHYARIGEGPDGSPALLRGIDHAKDQSYVLFGLPRERLARVMLPIGAMRKPAVRELARELGLPTFNKPDSQEICFVPDDDYAGLVERRLPDLARPGPLVDESGRELGEHAGHHRYTIGQRRGVNLALGYPVYVVAKDVATNTVVVGPKEALAVRTLTVGEANWLIDEPLQPGEWNGCFAAFRAHGTPCPARWRALEPGDAQTPSGRGGRFEMRFDEPQIGVAAGQAVVLYDAETGERVLGGGWIEQTAR